MSSSLALTTTVLGLGALAALAVFVPAQIECTAGGGTVEQQAQARLEQSLYESLSAETQLASTIVIPNQFHEHNAKQIAAARHAEATTEELRFARYLVTKGKNSEALPYYQGYVNTFPDAIKPRVELASVLLATNHPHEARLLCLRTLKRTVTSDEIGAVWQVLGQCQTK